MEKYFAAQLTSNPKLLYYVVELNDGNFRLINCEIEDINEISKQYEFFRYTTEANYIPIFKEKTV